MASESRWAQSMQHVAALHAKVYTMQDEADLTMEAGTDATLATAKVSQAEAELVAAEAAEAQADVQFQESVLVEAEAKLAHECVFKEEHAATAEAANLQADLVSKAKSWAQIKLRLSDISHRRASLEQAWPWPCS